MEGSSRTLKTTQTSLEIIELLDRLDGAGVTRLADELEKPPSTIHSHLATLHVNEYVVKEGGIYRLGLKFLELGRAVKNSKRLYQIANNYTKKLSNNAGYRSIFAVEEHGWGVNIAKNDGDLDYAKHDVVGDRFHLHSAAAGKAILAHLPNRAVDRIIERRGLPQLTEHTITDRSELKEELETVRKQGIAYNHEEQVQGVKAVSAPVLSQNGRVFGALAVNGPSKQLNREEFEKKITEQLRGVTNEFELDLELTKTANPGQ